MFRAEIARKEESNFHSKFIFQNLVRGNEGWIRIKPLTYTPPQNTTFVFPLQITMQIQFTANDR